MCCLLNPLCYPISETQVSTDNYVTLNLILITSSHIDHAFLTHSIDLIITHVIKLTVPDKYKWMDCLRSVQLNRFERSACQVYFTRQICAVNTGRPICRVHMARSEPAVAHHLNLSGSVIRETLRQSASMSQSATLFAFWFAVLSKCSNE